MKYVFRAGVGNQMAITDDETGAKVPKKTGAWIYDRPMEIKTTDGPRVGTDPNDIVTSVERDGYFILPLGETAT
jgi:hypothetical protein